MTVVVLGTLRFPPVNMAKVKPHLRALVEATRALDGCSAYDVAEDLFDPGLIRFSETWPDRATLARHLTAPHIGPWRTACVELGLTRRAFTAFQAGDSWSV
jgi:quinol monooxygenase YgiN